MRITIVVISVALVFVSSLYDNNYLVTPNKIVWSDSVMLSWSNFGGLELPGKDIELQTTLKNNERIAFLATTRTDIIYSSNGANYDVKAVFLAGKSFYKIYSDTLKLSPYSLRHELYHFHLTELFARYIRRDLASLRDPKPHEFDSIYQKHVSRLDSASAAYDRFTRHANIVTNQKRAEQLIDSLLQTMKDYQ